MDIKLFNKISKLIAKLNPASSEEEKQALLNIIEKGIEANPTDLYYWSLKVDYYFHINDKEKFKEVSKQALEIAPQNSLITKGIKQIMDIAPDYMKSQEEAINLSTNLIRSIPLELIIVIKIIILTICLYQIFL